MKIVHLNRSDILGGAARASYRLHSGLTKQGYDSSMFVFHKKLELVKLELVLELECNIKNINWGIKWYYFTMNLN